MGLEGDLYEANHFTRHVEQVGVLRHYWRQGVNTGTGPTQTQIAQALDTAISPPLKACMSNVAEYLGTKVYRIFPPPRTFPSDIFTSTGVGGVVSAILPRQVRGIITLRTLLAGKRYRGRRYIPFPAQVSTDTDATPTGPYLTLLDTLGTALITPLVAVGSGGNTATMTPVLVKLTYANHILQSYTFIPFDTRYSRNRWATQRRTGSYGPPNVTPF